MEYVEGAEFDEIDDDIRYSTSSKRKDVIVENFSSPLRSGDDYYFREKELNLLQKAFLKKEKRHLAIKGEIGIGRETLIKTLNQKASEDVLSGFNAYEIRILNLNYLVSRVKSRNQIEERVLALQNELEESSQEYFFYVQDFYTFITSLDETVLPSFRSLFKSSRCRIIIILTSEEVEGLYSFDKSLFNDFNIISIGPPNKEETKEILKTKLPVYKEQFKVEVPDNLIDEIIEYSNLYLPELFQPSKSISVIEEICASVKLNRGSNMSPVLQELKEKYDKLKIEKEDIKSQKNRVVKLQNYTEAASLRDHEKQLEAELQKIASEIIEQLKKEPVVTIQLKEIISGIHNLTGIEIRKLEKKEAVTIQAHQSSKREIFGPPQFEILQTQSILQGNQVSIKTGTAFVLIPHDEEFDKIFSYYIKPALECHGLTVLKADSINKPGNILSQVWSQICSAEVIVADVSGKNSNVIFEIGLCYGIRRCPILLTREPSELPFNIRNLRYIQYQNTAVGAAEMSEKLKVTVGEFLSAVRVD